MQGSYKYIPETNNVSRVYSVAVILQLTIYGTCNVTSHAECFVLLH